MSYSSYSRVKASIDEPTHTISQPVIPQAVDLRQFVAPRRQRAAAVRGGGVGSPLAGLAGMTEAVLAAAKGPRSAQNQQQQDQQHPAEQARQEHQQATLDSYTQAAEDTSATGPTGRHAYATPRGELVTATRNSRSALDSIGGMF